MRIEIDHHTSFDWVPLALPRFTDDSPEAQAYKDAHMAYLEKLRNTPGEVFRPGITGSVLRRVVNPGVVTTEVNWTDYTDETNEIRTTRMSEDADGNLYFNPLPPVRRERQCAEHIEKDVLGAHCEAGWITDIRVPEDSALAEFLNHHFFVEENRQNISTSKKSTKKGREQTP